MERLHPRASVRGVGVGRGALGASGVGAIRGGEEQLDGDVAARTQGEARQRHRELRHSAVRRELGWRSCVSQGKRRRLRRVLALRPFQVQGRGASQLYSY